MSHRSCFGEAPSALSEVDHLSKIKLSIIIVSHRSSIDISRRSISRRSISLVDRSLVDRCFDHHRRSPLVDHLSSMDLSSMDLSSMDLSSIDISIIVVSHRSSIDVLSPIMLVDPHLVFHHLLDRHLWPMLVRRRGFGIASRVIRRAKCGGLSLLRVSR